MGSDVPTEDERPPDERCVSFRLMGDLLDPEAIRAATGIEPDMAHRKGDPRPTTHAGPFPPRRSGLWRISSETAVSRTNATVEEHLVYLLDRLDPVKDAVARLAADQQLRADFFCGYFMNRLNSGWELTPRTLSRIAGLNAVLGFDVYGK